MIITIAGDAGSGKSTVAKALAKNLGFKHYSSGDFMREMATERGITLAELGKIAETNPAIDHALDKRQEDLGNNEDNFVIDARIGWYFIPHAKKIYLRVDPLVAAKRIYSDDRHHEQFDTVEKLANALKERRVSENKRYQTHYGIDQQDMNNYDIVIDTTKESIESTRDKIKEFLQL